MKVEGLHMHTGSDILDVEVFLKGAEIMLETAKEFKNLDYIDYGSGFKVAYKADDIATDIEELGKTLSERFNIFCKNYGKDLRLIFEPGKFLVSEVGIFYCQGKCYQANHFHRFCRTGYRDESSYQTDVL